MQYPTSMRTLSVGIGNFAAGLALITVPSLWKLVRSYYFEIFSIQNIFKSSHYRTSIL